MNNIINIDFRNKIRLSNKIKQLPLLNREIYGKGFADFIFSNDSPYETIKGIDINHEYDDSLLDMGFTEIEYDTSQPWEWIDD